MKDELIIIDKSDPQNIGQMLCLPYKGKALNPKSDSLDDVYIRFNELVNFVGEVLLASHTIKGLNEFLTDDVTEIQLTSKQSKSIKSPDIKINKEESERLTENIARRLFYSSIVHLATIYEKFLSELINEILRNNDEWLETDERPLMAKEIFKIGSVDKIRIIVAFDSSWFEVWSSKPEIIEKLRNHFEKVSDLTETAA